MLRLITPIRALLTVLLLAAPVPALAADYADRSLLDALFEQLRICHSPAEADTITEHIWSVWFTPNVPALADQMNKAQAAMGSQDFAAAKALLDDIVTTYPDYAEGWNRRATLEYEINDFTGSLADIDKVLALEPRHFGALSGRILIYLKQDRRADALKDMIAALAIDPYLSEKQLFPELQSLTNA
jgi:tetratricopeptide (TPR) repeat protein